MLSLRSALALAALTLAACSSGERNSRTTTRFREPDVGAGQSSAACSTLSACCPSLGAGDQGACDSVAGAGAGDACAALLSTYRSMGQCAGVDAGPGDAELVDSGSEDLGSEDLGSEDSGSPPDLGSEDTGAPDLGPPDTGVRPDLGPPDTGAPPDLGPRDTGVRDAGSPPDLGFPFDGSIPDIGVGMACVDLAQCCSQLSSQDRMTCESAAMGGEPLLCFILLQAYRSGGLCL